MTIRERFEKLTNYRASPNGDETDMLDRDEVLALADELDREAGRPTDPISGADFVLALSKLKPCKTDEEFLEIIDNLKSS